MGTPRVRREWRRDLPTETGGWIDGQLLAAFNAAGTDAHRIYSSADAWLECFGAELLLSFKNDVARERVLAGLPPWVEKNQFEHRRLFGRFLPRQNDERSAPVLIEGDAALPMQTVVMENGMRFAIDFSAGYSAGLFLDQRANRAFVRRLGTRRVLNTFAYTCSFSVAAALGGAATTSVDLSQKSLDRGRENFALNGLSLAGHRFYADDVTELLPRLARRGEKFDAIILDPPTFSRGHRGKKWQVERDFEELLVAALEVAEPGASVLLSTNCTRLDRRALEQIARHSLKLARRAGTFHREPPLPDVPAEFAAQTLWLTGK
jgi:23S rRNA (cytosine1962-C5)-methyltransferase